MRANPASRAPRSGSRRASPELGKGQDDPGDPLLAQICHDLRAPLASVTMGANFVLQMTPENNESARSRRVLQAMLRSCKQMERIVRDFGDLSAIEGNAVVLRPGLHEAGEILAMAAEGAREDARARDIQLEVTRPEIPSLVTCDRDRVLRALAHLLDNAVRFSPDGGVVSLDVVAGSGEVRFGVKDRGPGLSEETLVHLYDRHWHGQRAERVGAGLGLAIVRGFAEAHGGALEVASAPGATTFTLRLPEGDATAPR